MGAGGRNRRGRAAGLAVALLGCAAGPTLGLLGCAALSSEPHFVGEPTPEGLRRVENARVGFLELKPGADLGSYTAVLLEEPQIAFKRPPRPARDEFPLSEEQKQQLRSLFLQVFREELEQGGTLRVVDAPAGDVLDVRAAIVDLVVTAPPERGGRSHVLIQQTADLTLVAELRDASSDELLARLADRRIARRGAGGSYQSTPVNNRAAMRQVFARWARLLREGLERARELRVEDGA